MNFGLRAGLCPSVLTDHILLPFIKFSNLRAEMILPMHEEDSISLEAKSSWLQRDENKQKKIVCGYIFGSCSKIMLKCR